MVNGSHTNASKTSYGSYYSFTAANANTALSNTPTGDLSSNICPHNWTLPIGGTGVSQFMKLYTKTYGSNKALFEKDWGSVYAGNYDTGTLHFANRYAEWWTRTIVSTTTAWHMDAHTDIEYRDVQNYRYYGFSVRCLVK